MALIPHLISTIVIRPWSCGSPCYLHSIPGHSGTNHLQGCTIKPTTTCLLSFYTLFIFSHWNKSSSTADSENKYSERWWSADLALCRAGLIAQFIPSLHDKTPERRRYTAFCACSSIQWHNHGTRNFTASSKLYYVQHASLFFRCKKVFFDRKPECIAQFIHTFLCYSLLTLNELVSKEKEPTQCLQVTAHSVSSDWFNPSDCWVF